MTAILHFIDRNQWAGVAAVFIGAIIVATLERL